MSREHYTAEDQMEGTTPATDPGGEEPVNLLRRKTFNDELKGLVNRILDNESDSRLTIASDKNSAGPAGEEAGDLLKKMHGLFYRLKNLEGMLANEPFSGAGNHITEPDFLFTDPDKQLMNVLRRNGFSDYRLLIYNKNDRAFISPGVDDFDRSIIGIHDALFRSILEAPLGITVSRDEIVSDPFMQKRFPFLAGTENSLYINSTLRLTMSNDTRSNILLIAMSPLLIASGPAMIEPGRVTSDLKENATLAIRKLVEKHVKDGYSLKVSDHLEMIQLLDFCVSLYRDADGITSKVVRIDNSANLQDLTMMRYLFTRLARNLPPDSVIIRYNRDSMVIFTGNESSDIASSTINEYKNNFEGALTIQDVDMKKESLISLINRLQGL